MVVLGTPDVWAAMARGEWINIDQPLQEDLYAAGRDVRIGARVDGDVTAAGMDVRIEAIVQDDVNAAAEHVSVRAPIVDDLRAVGRRVDIAADIGDHVVAAGETVVVAEGVSIGGFAWLAGREVRVLGRIGKELRVAAERVILGGEVAGDVDVYAGHIELLPSARIEGDFRWHSRREPAVADDAAVTGRVIEAPLREREHEHARGARVLGTLFMALTLFLSGAVLLWVFPHGFASTADITRARPGRTLAIGLAIFAVAPLAVVVLLITGIGWLLALLVLFAWLVSLPIAWFVAAFTLGTVALPQARAFSGLRRWAPWLALLLGIVVLGLLQLLPWLGGIIALVALWLGLGALGSACYARTCASAPA